MFDSCLNEMIYHISHCSFALRSRAFSYSCLCYLRVTTMASSKPRASSAAAPLEESSVVQVLDPSDPLVASSSSGLHRVQVIDSSEPLVCETPCVQVTDSSEPLVPGNPSVPSSESSLMPSDPDSSDDTSWLVHFLSFKN